ncbi:MAG TPA: amino acid adenylation domain-containing protein, partial [Segetibacter sp.]|nr:amino acid adenylation domain-containing protein [Segetibacter sp.]
VGGGIAGRSQHEVEQLIGFFVNMLTFRNNVNSDLSFIELLSQVKETTLEAYSNQDVPFEKVVDTIVTERDLSRNPIFQVTFILQNTPKVPELKLGNVEFLIEEAQHTTSKFDLTFSITEIDSKLEVLVEYCTDLFKKETIARMLEHFKQLLTSVAKEPKQKIRMLEMLTAEEKYQILKEFNKTEVNYPKDKTIVDLFEEQVSRTPHKTALVFNSRNISYQQLNEQSNQVASYLRLKGVKEDVLVPLCIERSAEMIIGILGILKAGAAYVPIDPAFPDERIKYIFHDTSASIALCGSGQHERLAKINGVDIVTVDEKFLAAQSKTNLSTKPQPHNLAYIIYTSGSTGRPKGAMIEHRSVVSLIKFQTEEFKISCDERILQFSNYSFDASVEQIFLALFNGASLFLFAEGLQLETRLFEAFIKDNKITHLHATPSFLAALDPANYTSLKRVIAGGDLCKKELAEKWKATVDFYNEYGPTETTVTAIEYLANTATSEDAVNLPIGKPLRNVSAYILDRENNICPVGVPGELFIGGVQVSRGYLNRPDLTADSFVPDTFKRTSNGDGRLYKTGDFARWLPDGNIEFLGRIDTQVKIRGYRIEIGEIENVLQETGIVNETAIIAKPEDDGNMKLLSYFVPNATRLKEKEVELYEKQVLNWNTLYNTEYLVTKQDDNIDLEFDIIGWNDSFTGLPIPAEQMQYWLKDIVDVIFSEKPKNVLEIGCGTGLIYYQLAGKINKYIGTDFSRSSINQIQNWISKGLRNYGDTELYVCAAHEVSIKDEEQIDTVIINSV